MRQPEKWRTLRAPAAFPFALLRICRGNPSPSRKNRRRRACKLCKMSKPCESGLGSAIMSSIHLPRTASGLRFLAVVFSTLLFVPDASAALPPNVIRQVESAALDLARGRAADAHQKLQPLLEQSTPA